MAIHSMTQGPIPRQLLRFSVPMILGNLFQLTYNAVDTVIVATAWAKTPSPPWARRTLS